MIINVSLNPISALPPFLYNLQSIDKDFVSSSISALPHILSSLTSLLDSYSYCIFFLYITICKIVDFDIIAQPDLQSLLSALDDENIGRHDLLHVLRCLANQCAFTKVQVSSISVFTLKCCMPLEGNFDWWMLSVYLLKNMSFDFDLIYL